MKKIILNLICCFIPNKKNRDYFRKKYYYNYKGTELFSGERQVAENLENIRSDHIGRYEFSKKYLKDNDKVLDIACGVGYGTYILSNYNKTTSVLGADIASQAIDYANKYYKLPNNNFICGDCFKLRLDNNFYDKIISFETVEHIKDDKKLIKMYYNILKEDGLLILSTPNQELMPFTPKFKFHIRHYTPKELERLLNKCGFKISENYSQKTNQDRELIKGYNGIFNIVVCKKK